MLKSFFFSETHKLEENCCSDRYIRGRWLTDWMQMLVQNPLVNSWGFFSCFLLFLYLSFSFSSFYIIALPPSLQVLLSSTPPTHTHTPIHHLFIFYLCRLFFFFDGLYFICTSLDPSLQPCNSFASPILSPYPRGTWVKMSPLSFFLFFFFN